MRHFHFRITRTGLGGPVGPCPSPPAFARAFARASMTVKKQLRPFTRLPCGTSSSSCRERTDFARRSRSINPVEEPFSGAPPHFRQANRVNGIDRFFTVIARLDRVTRSGTAPSCHLFYCPCAI